MYLFIPTGGIRQTNLLAPHMRRDGEGLIFNQDRIKIYLREGGFSSYYSARVEGTQIFGVRVEIVDLIQIPNILSTLGLPDNGHVVGLIICNEERQADVWLNVAGVECPIDGSPTVHAPILQAHFEEPLRSQLQAVLKDFAIALNRSVRIRRGGRPAILTEPDGTSFTIWGWTSARETDRMEPPHRVFGHTIRFNGDLVYAASGEGIPLMDPDTGWCVAEIFQDHLFIHYNPFSNREPDIHAVREILNRTIVHLIVDPEVWQARRAAAEREARERSRDSYVALVNQRFVRILKTRQTELAELPNLISAARLELQRLIRLEQSLVGLIAVMRSGDQLTQYEVEFDRILSLPKVTKLHINGEKIVVHTTRLFCQNPDTGVIHRLAKMEIIIDTKAENYERVIKWRSLEGKIARDCDRPAPHVINHDGSACLGNAGVLIEQLFNQQEWEQLIHLAINFVESVNIRDSAGASLILWPHATPAELIGTEWEGQQVTVAA